MNQTSHVPRDNDIPYCPFFLFLVGKFPVIVRIFLWLEIMFVKLMSFNRTSMHAAIIALSALDLLSSVRGLDVLSQRKHSIKRAYALGTLLRHAVAIVLEQYMVVEVGNMAKRTSAMWTKVARFATVDHTHVHVQHTLGVEGLCTVRHRTVFRLDVIRYLERHG